MYIFKYVNKNTNEEIGYHLSTFCQVGPKEKAKRYQCSKGTESQIEIILTNLRSTLNPREGSIFYETNKSIAERYFPGLKFEDIELQAEYLADGIQPDDIEYKIHTIINNGVKQSVDIPMENLPEIINELHQQKWN